MIRRISTFCIRRPTIGAVRNMVTPDTNMVSPIINEVLNDRTDLHISRLQDRVTWGNVTATETVNMFTQRLQGMGDAALMAMKQLSQIVHRQAVVMGYADAFFMLTLFYFGLSLLVMLLKKPAALSAGGGH